MPGRFQFLFIVLCFCLTACRQEDPNPELHDPIYSDLLKQSNESEAALESEKKKLEKSIEALEKAPPLTLDLKNAERETAKQKIVVANLEQFSKFAKIRAERRRVEGRQSYRIAFAAGKDWPDPKEYVDYQTNKRLREAPRDWDAHLPKLFGKKPVAKKEAPKAEE